MVRHHPQWHAVRAHIRAGDIGTLRFMQVRFSYFNADATNIPNQAVALIEVDSIFGTDQLTSGLFGFAGGGPLAFRVSTQSVRYQRMPLAGTTGRIEIPFNARKAEPCRSMIQRAGGFITGFIVPPGIEPGPFL